jgi:hypothetical protein
MTHLAYPFVAMRKCSAFNAMMPTLAIPLAGEGFDASGEVFGFFLIIHMSMASLDDLPSHDAGWA